MTLITIVKLVVAVGVYERLSTQYQKAVVAQELAHLAAAVVWTRWPHGVAQRASL